MIKKRSPQQTGKSDLKPYDVDLDRFPLFKESLHRLEKKFPNARQDLDHCLSMLVQNPYGACRARQVRKVQSVYKARFKSRDLGKGSRGGFRLFYHIHENTIYPLFMLSKSEDDDDPIQELIGAVEELGL